MDPNALQPNQGGGQAPQPLDPSVVALTKAIGMAETPGTYGTPKAYNNPSPDPGSPPSAYQFTPGFIEKWAPAAGIQYQPGSTLSPADQDKLAYTAVKTMGTTGDIGPYASLGKLTPAQIASAWNAGDPNAYLEKDYQGTRTNKSGQQYNVPAYVSKVEANYNKLFPQGSQGSSAVSTANAASSPSDTSSSSSGPSWSDWLLGGLGAVGGFLAGAAKNNNTLIDSAGAGLGEAVGGPAGAIAGGGITQGILNAIGLGSTTDAGSVAAGDNTAGSSGAAGGDSGFSSAISAMEQQQPETNRAMKQEYDAVMQALGNTIGDRNLSKDSNVQEGVQTASMFGLMHPQIVNGSMNFQPNMDQTEKMIGDTHDSLIQAEHASGTIAPMQEVIEETMRNAKERLSPTEYEAAQKRADNLGASYLKEYGDGQGNIGTGHLLQAAVKEGRGKKYGLMETSTNKEVDKQFSLAARHVIRKHTKNPELYNRATKMEQNLINAKKVMKRLNGKKAPLKSKGGLMRLLLHRAGQSVAIAIGDKIGGIPGAIIGSIIGDTIHGRIDKKYSKTIFETPGMHRALKILAKKSPLVYARLQMELKKQGVVTPKAKRSQSADVINLGPRRGRDESIVVGGKHAPVDFEQAKKRKAKRPEYGGIYEKNKKIAESRKAALGK